MQKLIEPSLTASVTRTDDILSAATLAERNHENH